MINLYKSQRHTRKITITLSAPPRLRGKCLLSTIDFKLIERLLSSKQTKMAEPSQPCHLIHQYRVNSDIPY